MSKINKVLAITVLFLVLFTLFFHSSRYYSREAYVENNNGEELIFTDVRGHRWGWTIETNEEFKLKQGDIVQLKFNTNGTDEIIEDDILIKIKKIN